MKKAPLVDLLSDAEGAAKINSLYRAKHGYFLFNRTGAYIEKSLANYGEWSDDEVALICEICEPGDVVIEAGAYIGDHTVGIANRLGPHGKLYAFEPVALYYRYLNANLALNNVQNVECFHTGVAEKTGTADILNFYVDDQGNQQTMGLRPTPVVSLDEAISTPKLKLIKADIEGMELPMLKGATRLIKHHRPFLYLENNPDPSTSVILNEYLMALDYTLYWHVTTIYRSNNYAGNEVNVFGQTSSFDMLCVPNEKRYIPNPIYNLKQIVDPRQPAF